jgi:hypothetical protein
MKILTAIFCIVFFACSNSEVKSKNTNDSSSISKAIDTTQDEENEPDYRKEYIETYSKKISIDTAFIQDGKKYRIIFNHFCTMDSGLIVPAKYNFDTKKDFLTHNFKSDLTLIQEKDTLFRKQIIKSDFDPVLYSALKQYATLQSPILEIKNVSILIHYSISIPVTDVGIAAIIEFDKSGNFKVKDK